MGLLWQKKKRNLKAPFSKASITLIGQVKAEVPNWPDGSKGKLVYFSADGERRKECLRQPNNRVADVPF